ncbi:MAG: hypothetical protein ACRCYX_00890, partial [Dermatophilaceae bacterium]
RRDDRAGWGLIEVYEALTTPTDASLDGPPPPGRPRATAVPAVARPIDLSQTRDTRERGRTAVLWWSIGGVTGVAALTLGGLLHTGRRRTSDPLRHPE